MSSFDRTSLLLGKARIRKKEALRENIKATGQAPRAIEARLSAFDPQTGLASGPLKSIIVKFGTEEEQKNFLKNGGQRLAFESGKAVDKSFYVLLRPKDALVGQQHHEDIKLSGP